MRIKEVFSSQNPWYKEVKNLIEKNRFRKKESRFTVEGFQEVGMALLAGYTMESIAFDPENTSEKWVNERLAINPEALIIHLNSTLMKTLTVRGEVENVIAVFKSDKIAPLSFKDNTSILILEGIEKPGNLGAILRSAEASRLDEIWLIDAKVDPFHPQVIRNSLGTVFHVNIRIMNFEECLQLITEEKIQLFTTFIDQAIAYYDADFTGKFAIVMGTEHEGVKDRWRNIGNNIMIPMLGRIDSLNVSVASAVLLYEMVRQRRNIDGSQKNEKS